MSLSTPFLSLLVVASFVAAAVSASTPPSKTSLLIRNDGTKEATVKAGEETRTVDPKGSIVMELSVPWKLETVPPAACSEEACKGSVYFVEASTDQTEQVKMTLDFGTVAQKVSKPFVGVRGAQVGKSDDREDDNEIDGEDIKGKDADGESDSDINGASGTQKSELEYAGFKSEEASEPEVTLLVSQGKTGSFEAEFVLAESFGEGQAKQADAKHDMRAAGWYGRGYGYGRGHGYGHGYGHGRGYGHGGCRRVCRRRCWGHRCHFGCRRRCW